MTEQAFFESMAPARPDWPDLPWAVVRVRPRQEKKLADQLRAKRIWCFLPLGRSVRYYEHRTRVTQVPLFPGYLFARAEREDLFWADRTGRVTQLLEVPDERRLEDELRGLWIAEQNGAELIACPPLEIGDRVEVARGPMRGVKGVVERQGRANRLVLAVSIVNGAAEMEIDPSVLERCA